MKTAAFTAAAVLLLALGAVWGGAAEEKPATTVHLPWKEAGLTERQAAAHLLNRFAYGPRPGEVDAVVKMGLDRWFERQLSGDLPDGRVAEDLRALPALGMSTAELVKTYPPIGVILYEAKEAGVLPDSTRKRDVGKQAEDEALREKVVAFARSRGYRPQRELLGQLMTQKLVRAVESENQLTEVMTDFWFNHFNVSLTDRQARSYLLSYERDAIRAQALGRFRDLLGATAKSPAMLLYLDNAQSSAAEGSVTTMKEEIGRRPGRRAANLRGRSGFGRGGFGGRMGSGMGEPKMPAELERLRPRGLNENYARELLELHTLGVDGGYTQQDVVEVARAFTGWSVLPPGRMRGMAEARLARAETMGGLGFHNEGELLFRADQHDAGEKAVLGVRLPAGRGMEDGEAVLDLVSGHPSTARHIAEKLAVRFVSDHPPASLVDRLAEVFVKTGGDSRRLLIALAESPELWSQEALGAKVKSPFELVASALRATGGEVFDPREILEWTSRMGQPLYAYQAPTGFPDRAEAWVNTGSLLSRMSFGLQLAAGRVRGVDLDLPKLNGGREPESREEALKVYAGLLMPGRDLASTLKLLGPMVSDPNLAKKVDQASPKNAGQSASKSSGMSGKGGDEDEALVFRDPELNPLQGRTIQVRGLLGDEKREPMDRRPPTPLEQVVGVILGSPEFQRR